MAHNALAMDIKLQKDIFVLPESKVNVENVSKDFGVYKIKLDFSKISETDFHALFDYLRNLPDTIKCIDLSDCNVETQHVHLSLGFLSLLSKIQKIKLSSYVQVGTPLSLNKAQRTILLLEQQFNSDVLVKKFLTDFLENIGEDNERSELIPNHIKNLKFSSTKMGIALLPWQDSNCPKEVYMNAPSLQDYNQFYETIKKNIEKSFAFNINALSVFTKVLFVFCDKEFKKANKKQNLNNKNIKFMLESLTLMALILELSPFVLEEDAKQYALLIQDLLGCSEHSAKIMIFDNPA